MFVTRAEARALDRRAMDEFGIPGIVLMENAGRGIAELLLALGVQGRVVVCCGKGNNGGDGLVVARHLANASVWVRVLLFARPEDLCGDAAVAYRMFCACGIETIPFHEPDLNEDELRRELALADWVVDGLFGSGLMGAVRPPFDRVISAINAGPSRILAIDIPSGLDSDTGLPLGSAVRAHHTATIAVLKAGFAQEAARDYLGRLHVIDMGVPRQHLHTA
jgi:NAD(P)H-hydrate epimerase